MPALNALQFFAERLRGGADGAYNFLAGLASSNPPTPETETLEFKGNVDPGSPDLKRIWSKSLSGFANTQGGVLVFGVDAREDPTTKIDVACGLAPIQQRKPWHPASGSSTSRRPSHPIRVWRSCRLPVQTVRGSWRA